MRFNKVAPLGLAVALSLSACAEERSVNETRSKVETTVQSSGSTVSSAPSASASAKPKGYCPPEMVKVKHFCVDRYESSLYDVERNRRVDPSYSPHRYSVKNRFKYFREGDEQADAGPPKTRVKMGIPKPPDWELETDFRAKALPIKGQVPNAYLSGISAETVCRNAGKRLCTEEEWVTACRGENSTKFPYGNEYEEGACNIAQQGWAPNILYEEGAAHHLDDPRLIWLPLKEPFIEKTGSRAKCVSKWGNDGIYDMVGNLQEWIDDEKGTFVGGFSNLPSKEGCDVKQPGHKRPHFDYSLGTRCCTDLFDKPQPAKDLPKAEPDRKPELVAVRPKWPIVCFPKEVSLPSITVLPRESWGAQPADNVVLGAMENCDNLPVEKITFHHTGESAITKPGQEKGRLRNAQQFHMSPKVGWGDIAYHYAVGLDGTIYEGRNPAFRGDSFGDYYPGQNHSHTPEHHLLITVIGNYQKQELTEATRQALANLINANLQKYSLSKKDVLSHKDIGYTGCPGKHAIKWLNDWIHPASVPRQSLPGSPSQMLLSPDGSAGPHNPLPQTPR